MRMVEMAPVPTYYADDIGAAELLSNGTTVRVWFCQEKLIGHERVLVPEVSLIRPLVSCQKLTLQDMLKPQILGTTRRMIVLGGIPAH